MSMYQDITPNRWRTLSEHRGIHFCLLLILSFILIFYNLGGNSFHNGDEAMYALSVKEILRTGDWLTLFIEGEAHFNKPPLVIWLGAVASKIFGFSEFSVRLPSALFGVFTVFLTYLLAERLYDRKTAALSSLMLLTCTQFVYVHASRTGEFDTALTFFITASVYCTWKTLDDKKYLYFAFLFIGLVAMVKNVVCVVPFGILVIFLLVSGRIRTIGILPWVIGIWIFLAVALPWHIAQYVLHGKAFVDLYLMDQVVGRRVGAGMPLGISNPLFFLKVMFRGFYPWSLIVPFAFFGQFLCLKNRENRNTTLLLFTWITLVFIICNAITAKFFSVILQSWYILPIYPALAIMNSRFFSSLLTNPAGNTSYAFSLSALFLLLLIFRPDFDYNPFVMQSFKSLITVQPDTFLLNLYHKNRVLSLLVGIGFCSIFTAILLILIRKLQGISKAAAYAICTAFIALSLILSLRPLRFSGHQSEFSQINHAIRSISDVDSVLLVYGNNLPIYKDSIYFHDFKRPGKNTVQYIGLDKEQLWRELANSEGRLCFMERQHYYDIRASVRFRGIVPKPKFEWSNYVLLGNSAQQATGANPGSGLNFERLYDTNPVTRIKIIEQLGKEYVREAAPLLIGLLDDADTRIVLVAAKALSDLRHKDAINALERSLLRLESNSSPYHSISLALAYLNAASTVDYLAKKYSESPIYSFQKKHPPGTVPFTNHNQYWTAYLLYKIDPGKATEIIEENLRDYFCQLQDHSDGMSLYNRMNFLLFKLGNDIALNIIEHLGNSTDLISQKISVHLLTKPPDIITRMSNKDMDRAQALLATIARKTEYHEIRLLAEAVLRGYHRNAWVGW